MSHVATVGGVIIKSMTALEKACKAIGLDFKEGQKNFKWYGKWVNDYSAGDAAYRNGVDTKDYGKCEHAIGVHGKKDTYEVGLVKTDGGYKMVYDNWQGGMGLEKVAGKGLHKLVDEYSKEVMLEEAAKQGYMTSVQEIQGGGYEVVLTQY